MPREQINFPQPERWDDSVPATDTSPAVPGRTGGTRTDPALHVIWQKQGGHVQIAFQADAEYFADPGLERPDGERPIAYTGKLERYDINRMIRALRVARDQAYGRDE